jgi:hypothetical protein
MSELCYACYERPRYHTYSYCKPCWNKYQRELKRLYAQRAGTERVYADDIPETRVCPGCAIAKPVTEWVSRPRSDGKYTYSWRCLDCKQVYDRAYRLEHQTEMRDYHREKERERRSLGRLQRDLRFHDKALAVQRLVRQSRAS